MKDLRVCWVFTVGILYLLPDLTLTFNTDPDDLPESLVLDAHVVHWVQLRETVWEPLLHLLVTSGS